MKKLILSALFAILLPMFSATAAQIYYSCADGNTYEDYAEIDSEYTIQSYCPSGTYEMDGTPYTAGGSIWIDGDRTFTEQVTYYNVYYSCVDGSSTSDTVPVGEYIIANYCSGGLYSEGKVGDKIYVDTDMFLSETGYYVSYSCADGYSISAYVPAGKYIIENHCPSGAYNYGNTGDTITLNGDMNFTEMYEVTYQCLDGNKRTDIVSTDTSTPYTVAKLCPGSLYHFVYDYYDQKVGVGKTIDKDIIKNGITLTEVQTQPTIITYDCGNGIARTQTVEPGADFTTLSMDFCNLAGTDKLSDFRGWYVEGTNNSFCNWISGASDVDSYLTYTQFVVEQNKTYSTMDTLSKTWVNNGEIAERYVFTPVLYGPARIVWDQYDVFPEMLSGISSDFKGFYGCDTVLGVGGDFLSSIPYIYDCQNTCLNEGADAEWCVEICSQYQITNSQNSTLKGLNTKSDGSGEYVIDVRSGTLEYNADVCVYPECTTLYEIWDEKLSINIDVNGGTISGLSGLVSASDIFGMSQEELQAMSGNDIWGVLMTQFGNDIIAGCQNGTGECTRADHTFVGFSPSPDGMVENPTCVFPECDTIYAIWELNDGAKPGLYIDLNGGTWSDNDGTFQGLVMASFNGMMLNGETMESIVSALGSNDLYTPIPDRYFSIIDEMFMDALDDNRFTTSSSTVKFTGPGIFVGFNTRRDGTGALSCVYPECNTLYAIWHRDPPTITVDFNGGVFSSENGDALYQDSGQVKNLSWSYPAAPFENVLYYRKEVFDLVQNMADNPTETDYLVRPGYNYVGANTEPDGSGYWQQDAEKCVYPYCTSFYSIWEPKEDYTPGIFIDFNDGELMLDGKKTLLYQVYEDDAPELEAIKNQDITSLVDTAESDLYNEVLYGNLSRDGYRFVGLSTKKDEMVEISSCVYPECHAFYAIWEEIEQPTVAIDWGAGQLTFIDDGKERVFSGVMPVTDSSGYDNVILSSIEGIDIWNNNFRGYIRGNTWGGYIVEAIESGIVTSSHPDKYVFVGLSPDPNGMVDNPTCVYPDCHTFYAIWARPEIVIDFNGGTLNHNGQDLSSYTVYAANAPELESMDGVDLWDNIGWDAEFYLFVKSMIGDFIRPEYRFVGFSTDKNEMTDSKSCVYPECHKYYVIWEKIIHPDVFIDMNGGYFNVPDEGISTNYFHSDYTNDELANSVGVDIWNNQWADSTSGQEISADMLATYNEDNSVFTHPNGYKLLGLSPNPNYLESNPTCIYPDCHTFYAIWYDDSQPLPNINVDMNGGEYMANGMVLGDIPIVLSNDPDIQSLVGKDLYSTELTPSAFTSGTIDEFMQHMSRMESAPRALYSVSRPGYRLVGFSADPNTPGVTQCIYPECHTYHAIWKPITVTNPGIYVDFNGATFSMMPYAFGKSEIWRDVVLTESGRITIVPDNASWLPDLINADLWTTDMSGDGSGLTAAVLSGITSSSGVTFARGDDKLLGFSAAPDRITEKCIYPDCNVIYAVWEGDIAMCPVAKNLVLGNGTKIPLYKHKQTSPALAMRYKKQICYADMTSDAKSGTINIKYNGDVYHAE